MYICNVCQSEYKKWHGQCLKCKSWNTIEVLEAKQLSKVVEETGVVRELVGLDKIDLASVKRITSGVEQLDRVLGGGFVPGSLTLLGGKPGIGKSTLILRIAEQLAKTKQVLYVSGEENLEQIKLRPMRLNITGNIQFLSEQNSQNIIASSIHHHIDVLIVDSIQTTASPVATGASGSVSQLKTIAMEMMNLSKSYNITTILIGHVTKDGDIAGPKLLEHMVDTVIYLELDNKSDVRVLRSEKNRYGTTNEIGMLVMTSRGLMTYEQNQSIKQLAIKHLAGTAMTLIKVGKRDIFIEIQSLITATSYPSPKRSCQGIDLTRLNIMLAIVQKHLGCNLTYDDVYLKMRGNYKSIDTGIDLGIIVSLYSSKIGIPINSSELFLGEVTLSGMVLPIPDCREIISCAKKFGYTKIFCNTNITDSIVRNITDIKSVFQIIRSENANI